jgi:copper transport protein
MTRTARRLVAFLAVITAVLVGWAGVASAHASLIDTQPAAQAVLDQPPAAVSVRFNEAVGIPPEALRLFDANGNQVSIGSVGHGSQGASTITASVPSSLGQGLYVVAWRAVSADSHPVEGAFTFQIGSAAPVRPPSDLLAQVLRNNGTVSSASWVAGITRFAVLVGLAALIGAVAFPFITGSDENDPRWRALRRWAAAGAAMAAVLALVAEVPASTGRSLGAVADGTAWRSLLETTAGRAALVRAIVLVVVAAVVWLVQRRSRAANLTVLIGTAVAIVASSMAGHGATGRWVAAGILVTMAHYAAMGVWLGGLLVLAVVTLASVKRAARAAGPARRRPDRDPDRDVDNDDDELAGEGYVDVVEASAQVTRFSTAAFVAVVVLIITGVIQAFRQLESWSDLRDTRYGHLLLIKTGLVVVMVAVGALSRRVVHRQLALRPAGAAPAGGGPRMLRQRVLVEIGIGAVVLAVTAALMASNPAAASGGVVSRTLVSGDVVVSLTVDPARTGPNEVHLYLSGPGGSLQELQEVSMTATLPSRKIGPLPVPLVKSGPNHYIADAAQFPFSGQWKLEVSALVSEFDRRIVDTTIHISG